MNDARVMFDVYYKRKERAVSSLLGQPASSKSSARTSTSVRGGAAGATGAAGAAGAAFAGRLRAYGQRGTPRRRQVLLKAVSERPTARAASAEGNAKSAARVCAVRSYAGSGGVLRAQGSGMVVCVLVCMFVGCLFCANRVELLEIWRA